MQSVAWLSELKQEAASTTKLLEKVPDEQFDWKPHEKSMTLKQLATHVAEMSVWLTYTISTEYLDFSETPYKPTDVKSTAELVAFHQENVQKAADALTNCTDEQLADNWTMKNGDLVYFSMPRYAVLRNMVYNHLIHHRGQLSVYLRLLDVAIPGLYGPSADDKLSNS